jgi:hypothetical protein
MYRVPWNRTGLCLASTSTQEPGGPALASQTNTSRLHDNQPVVSHRGCADDELQTVLQLAVEDLRDTNVV